MPSKLTKAELIKHILQEEMQDIEEDEDTIHLLLENTVSTNINRESITLGGRISDAMARVAGSWAFIIPFCMCILLWVVVNAILLTRPYDPYPFILLNLVLSCVAAIQAPVIMMSQNRQEQKDRLRAENDYKINLKSEIIIEDMHLKLDRLIMNQEMILQWIGTDTVKQEEDHS